jgi:hypothetical protein
MAKWNERSKYYETLEDRDGYRGEVKIVVGKLGYEAVKWKLNIHSNVPVIWKWSSLLWRDYYYTTY